ncbi:putative RNA-directed DNA polymerase, eukaryota, reverse transcriptase zinc-binding domain protein [Tanacetum coccineum]
MLPGLVIYIKATNPNHIYPTHLLGDPALSSYCAFVKHYNQFLGAEGVSNPLDAHDLFIRVLDNSKADCMVRDVTDDEIKSVMFSMGDDRAPGHDGFTAAFFKKAWDVVGGDITCAIRDFFFSNGKLLKELNHTIISLIPKVTTPARINDYRPISCCNVLYKCISKIIANRVKEGLGDIFSINQSAFVPGHRISNNILLTQELMRNYHRRRGPLRCAFKVDIQKAYDTVDWNFLETILVGFGFHPKMVQWIMVCVSGASYSISVNGNVHGWFKGKHGLRQGDPLSPYLFTLFMEILTLLLQRKVRNSDEFQYHHLCEQERIINLCFTDDLFLFARGHPSSVSVIMDALEEFKYLGVPLISSRLLFHDCKILVEKLESRVNDWRNKFLSLASRLQLIWSILSSMYIYWSSVFILPSRIVNDLEQLMRGFLWCQREMKKGKAKVAWDSMCMPKHEGDLGIRRIEDFNIALMATHIWSIFTHRESLMITCSLSVLFLRRCGLRIVVAATSYYIWLERNGRLFKKKTSTPGQIVDVIFSTVRLKLVSFKFKKMSTKSRLLIDQWKIPSYCIVHDGSTRQPYLDLYCSYRVTAGLRDARLIIYSSKESVGTPFGRVLWFIRIPTTVPVTTPTIDPPVIHDDTSLIPTETPTISPITSTIPPTAPTTHYTSPFIHTDSSNDDTPDTPPSPTHEMPSVEVAPPTGQILPAPFGVHRRQVTIVSPG